MAQRKIILYISMSLDGFIATQNDDISWLGMVQKEGLDYGYQELLERVDTYIIGRQTYDVIKSLTGGKLPQAAMFDCYVITREERDPEDGVTFYSGDIQTLIDQIRQKEGKDIYCDGGGQIVKIFLEHQLIDEMIISVIPVLLGAGKRLFLGGIPGACLELLNSRSFETGLVQLHYRRK